ncbi:DUF2855 family protein [Temperatibacter marinus]|uniref:DUF2855 family protein n=1 Tax=Temperatibacter marinus TaxID=1456591 RepID=A0AA52EHT1_9PROT|nr:DUF2855 family protein [Temperatibacter marinus]WND03898.1 DUF2855 family protein [Temperatibacter marinus]
MSKIQEIWTDRVEYSKQRFVEKDKDELEPGQILVEIDKFALTANNVSYALSGEAIGYWGYFPTHEGTWGNVPVWGMATVSEVNGSSIKVGERLYGFFPMSSHLIMSPGKISEKHFMDETEHRRPLPPLYNQYMRTEAEPAFMQKLENERCLYFPLFITGYVIADFLMDQSWMQAEQIIISSISSKTGYSCANFIKSMGFEGNLVGITSPRNHEFVTQLGTADQVISYGEEDRLNKVSSVYVDMSGDGNTRREIHSHFADLLKSSQVVGATHWESERTGKGLDGPKPEFFFAPSQIAKRNQEWGPGVLLQKGSGASADLAAKLADQVSIEFHQGAQNVMQIWADLLANKVSGQKGLIVNL